MSRPFSRRVAGSNGPSPMWAARRACAAALASVVGGDKKHLAAAGFLQPKIGARVELDDLHALLQQSDEGQEQIAVAAVLIEPLGRRVGGRDHHDAGGEQRRKQPRQNGRVGDVGHREFVETQQPRLARKFGGDAGDGGASAIGLAAGPVQPFVNFRHEGVEMHAPLFLDRRRVEEKVHERRLAAPDMAPEIDAARGAPRRSPLEKGEEAKGRARGRRARQIPGEPVQRLQRHELRGVAFDGAGSDQRVVTGESVAGKFRARRLFCLEGGGFAR